MPLKFKVTEEMIDAGVKAVIRSAEDYAMRECQPIPDFENMDSAAIKQGRDAVRAVIQAAAEVALKELDQ